jgi:hypothetical protein
VAANQQGDGNLDNLFSFLDEFGANAAKDSGTIKLKQKAAQQTKDLINELSLDFDSILQVEGAPAALKPKGSRAPLGESSANIENVPREAKAMKANPLARKEVTASKENLVKETGLRPLDWPMTNYAEKYFEKHIRQTGTLTLRKPNKNNVIPVEEMICFTKAPLPTSMTKIPNVTEKQLELATEAFKLLIKAVDLGPKKADEAIPLVQQFVGIGIDNPELRDELFVQLCRETTENTRLPVKTWQDIETAGWFILAQACGSFPPSKIFSKYLLSYIMVAIEREKLRAGDVKDMSSMGKYAFQCETSLKQIMLSGPRKCRPSAMEVQSVRSHSPLLCRFYLLDGQVKALGVAGTTTCGDAIRELSSKIGLKESLGWSLYETRDGKDRLLRATDYVADVLSTWEPAKALIPANSYQTLRKNTSREISASGPVSVDSRLYLKKRMFKNPNEIPADPVEFGLIYAQAAYNVVRDTYAINEKTAMQLASLKAQVDWGNFDPSKKDRL